MNALRLFSLKRFLRLKPLSFCGIVIGCFLPVCVCAQTARKIAPIPVEAAIRAVTLRRDCPIDLSPDGELIAYTVRDETRRTTETDERYRNFSRSGVSSFAGEGNDVLITDLKTGAVKNLTAGKGTSWTPSWSPDGKTLAFYSDRDGLARIWLWNRVTGQLRKVSNAIARPLFANEKILWTPDGKKLLVKLLPEDKTLEAAAKLLTAHSAEDTKPKSAGATVYLYRSSETAAKNAAPAESDAIHLYNRGVADFAAIEVTTGKIERLAKNIHIRGLRLSPSGERAALLTSRRIAVNPPDNLHDLKIISLKTNKVTVLQTDISGLWSGEFLSWSPDEKFIALNSFSPQKSSRIILVSTARPIAPKVFELPLAARPADESPLWQTDSQIVYFGHLNAVWKLDIKDNKAEKLAEIPERRLLGIVAPFQANTYWSNSDARSLVVKTFSPETLARGFYRLDLQTRAYTPEIENNSNYGGNETLDISQDKKLLVTVIESAASAPQVWATKDSVLNFRQVTRVDQRLDGYATGESRLIEYQTAKGRKLRAALLLPAGYEKGKRYPVVAYVYGGINLSSRANDYGLAGQGVNNMQLLASRGYAVLLPDLPTRGANISADLTEMMMPALDKIIELGIADKDRVGVMGHSFGGYTTISLLSQTNRFRAGVMIGGFGNIFALYGVMRSDGEAFNVDWWEKGPNALGDSPWKARDKYIENSPVYNLDKVKTPLLIVHGAQDVSTPPFLADEIFVGLRRLGADVVYAKYENEGHNPAQWGFANQVDYATRLINWFDKHLKGQ